MPGVFGDEVAIRRRPKQRLGRSALGQDHADLGLDRQGSGGRRANRDLERDGAALVRVDYRLDEVRELLSGVVEKREQVPGFVVLDADGFQVVVNRFHDFLSGGWWFDQRPA